MYHVSMCYTFNAIFLLAYVWLTVVVIDCNTWCIFRRSGYISFVLSYQYPCDIERVPNPVSDVICIYVAGEPFINGEAVPYDPKYHEEWVRNNARANERSRCNDRPRNFERRRENMQNFQNRDAPPGQGFNNPPLPFQPGIQPRDAGAPLPPPPQNAPMHHAQSNMPPPPQNAGAPPTYQPHASNPQAGYAPGACGYQGGPLGYEGGNQGYQGRTGGNMQGGPAPAYQSNPGYHGGPGYPSSNLPLPPFQGGGQPPFQSSNSPPYQGGNQNYGGATSYQGQPGNPSYHGTNIPPYEGRDGTGSNYQ
jgi:hypothetical protein